VRRTGSPAARQAAILFGIVGLLRLLALAVPGTRTVALLAVGLADLLLGGLVWVLPWERWPRLATLTLTVPAIALVVVSSATGLVPPNAIGMLFVLVFVWVGGNHQRWTSLLVAPLAALAYPLAVSLDDRGLRVDPRVVLLVTAMCVLVAETVALSQDRLRAMAAETSFLARHTTDLVTRSDLDGTIRHASPSVHTLLGWLPEQLVGRHVQDFWHPDDPATVPAADRMGEPVTVVRRMRRRDDGWVWFECVSRVVTGPEGHPAILSSARDITARRQLEAELAHVAMHDPLTGLPNRALLTQRLTTALAAERSSPLAVAFLDLDGFKAVNDKHGHDVGDELLRQVAGRLKQVTRESDTVSRYGGDEFVLVIDGLPHQREVLVMAQRVEAALSTPYSLGERTVRIGASVGVTFVPPGISAEQAIASADSAMYARKAARRVQRGVAPRTAYEELAAPRS
jgi:diguanylate cyclase (GGDEF)-like protein/PAS domain S-box-containing protein